MSDGAPRGQKMGRYELLSLLAVGGMAELYRAEMRGPQGFKKIVAIKKILPVFQEDERFREMFVHEGRIMAALSHRNLVQVFELGEADEDLYLCLEYVQGCNLAELIAHCRKENAPPSPALAAWIAREICQALHYVHRFSDDSGRCLRIVHRDVTPQNILLSDQGDVKLGDFGVAKSGYKNEGTLQGHIKGNLRYLSPEQANGEEVTSLSDLYAVGLILFEILTLQPCIPGGSNLEILTHAARPVYVPPSSINPQVSRGLDALLERLLRVEPESRYGHAAALSEALGQIIKTASKAPTNADLEQLVAAVVREKSPPGSPSGAEALHPRSHPAPDGNASSETTDPVRDRSAPPLPPPHRPVASGTEVLPLGVPAPGASRPRSGDPRLLWAGLGIVSLAAFTIGLLRWSGPASPLPDQVATPPPAPRETAVMSDPPRAAAAQGEQATEEEAVDGPKASGNPPAALKRKPVRPARSPSRRRDAVADRSPPGGQASPGEQHAAHGKGRDQEAAPSLAALAAETARMKQRMRARGFRPLDSAELDAILARVEQDLQRGQTHAAANGLELLDARLENTPIDRKFLERKIQRLQAELQRSRLASRFSAAIDEILDHVLNSRYGKANEAINRILDQLP